MGMAMGIATAMGMGSRKVVAVAAGQYHTCTRHMYRCYDDADATAKVRIIASVSVRPGPRHRCPLLAPGRRFAAELYGSPGTHQPQFADYGRPPCIPRTSPSAHTPP